MFPSKTLQINGGLYAPTTPNRYGEPTASAIRLDDGSTGTRVFVRQYDWDGQLDFDRFGHIVGHSHGKWGSRERFTDILNADGSEYHLAIIPDVGTTTTTINADGSKLEVVEADIYSDQFPATETRYTPGRVLERLQTYQSADIETETKYYTNGTKVVEHTNRSDDTVRILSYDAKGNVDHEQRFDAAGRLNYDVSGTAAGDHTVMQVRADGIHTSVFEGSRFVFKDLARTNGTFESFAYAADQTHGGAAGNDSFNGFAGGADTFVFGADFGSDTIRRFETSRDAIKFVNPAIDAADISLSYGHYGSDTIITVADEGTITLKGVHVNSVAELHLIGDGFITA